jgi:hypothetical protein
MTELLVPSRFRGPASSGNGGWTAGALAALVEGCPTDHAKHWPVVEVTLRKPPPLDVELAVTTSAATATCEVGEARCVDRDLVFVEPVSPAEARAAEASYPGLVWHPFPTCFSCGTGRAEGDGLRIFPGRVKDAADGSQRVGATWTPHPSVVENFHEYADATPRASLPVTWAALDCVGGWAGDLTDRLMVLGRMTTQVDALPVIGEPHVLVGQRLGAEGRKTFTAATLYDADDRIVARAEHVWIAVDPTDFG